MAMLLHRFYIENSRIYEKESFKPNSGIEIYEVIRVMEGIPLFLEDHLSRFFHSAWLCHLEIPLAGDDIKSMLKELISVNNVTEGNIRFSFAFRPTSNFRAYFIPHRYPTTTETETGVECGILYAERSDPNAKVVQASIRESADQMIKENNLYEVLLVNNKLQLTEGSRSNLFFLKEGTFFTAPEAEVLPGITRNKVVELISMKGSPFSERSLTLEEISSADAAFITGTSPKILPVRKIGLVEFTVRHPLITQIMLAYDRSIRDYIQSKKINIRNINQ